MVAVGVFTSHFQRLFRDVAGVDPADLDWLIRYLNGDTYDLLTDIEIDESKAYDNTQAYKSANITLNRTIKVGMNTVVLPFALTAEDIAYLGGADAEAYTVSEYDPAIDDFKFAQLDEVPANNPFFLKATVASADREDGNVFTFEGKTIVAGEPVATVGKKMISIHDKYCIDLYQPEFEQIVVAIVIQLEKMIEDRSENESSSSFSFGD